MATQQTHDGGFADAMIRTLHRKTRVEHIAAQPTFTSHPRRTALSGPVVMRRPRDMAKRLTAARNGTKAAVGRYVKVVPLSSTVPYPSSYAPCEHTLLRYGCSCSLWIKQIRAQSKAENITTWRVPPWMIQRFLHERWHVMPWNIFT